MKKQVKIANQANHHVQMTKNISINFLVVDPWKSMETITLTE